MNIHLNLEQTSNMIYEDPICIKEEKQRDIIEGVSRSMLAAKTFSEDSFSSMSSSSSDLTEEDDDASSSSSNGPLEDLSDLMANLPIKRGLSRFYEGKSQSFTSLGNVKSLEDLMKKGYKNKDYGARRKACKSTGGISEQSYKGVYSPKGLISKKSSRTPYTLSSLAKRRY